MFNEKAALQSPLEFATIKAYWPESVWVELKISSVRRSLLIDVLIFPAWIIKQK